MLNADLPQLLGSSVVRKLKADGAFKLLVLMDREGREMEGSVRNGAGDTGTHAFTSDHDTSS